MNNKLKTTMLLVASGLVLPVTAQAKQEWSDFSISYLSGSDYEVGDPDREYITVEHVSGHSWGDNFFFIDREISSDGSKSHYMELSPRISLGKLSGKELSFGPVKDVLLAGTWEAGNGFDNFLAGVGFSFDVPGFQYFNANVYHARNENTKDDTLLTLTWGAPFSISNADFLYDGFIDWSTSASDHNEEINFTSQLKWNAGKHLGSATPIYVGVEYAHWTNKFGLDADERSPSLLLKWHF